MLAQGINRTTGAYEYTPGDSYNGNDAVSTEALGKNDPQYIVVAGTSRLAHATSCKALLNRKNPTTAVQV